MKIKIKFLPPIQINFVIGKSGQTLKNGKETISIVFKQKGFKSVYKTTGLSTFKHHFVNEVVQDNDDDYIYINKQLSQLKTNYYTMANDYLLKYDHNPTIQQLLDYSNNFIPKTCTFKELFESFVQDTRREDSTTRNYVTLINSLEKFNKKLMVNEFTLDTIEKYQRFMIKGKLKQNTRVSRHKQLNALCNYAVKKGILEMNPYNEYVVEKTIAKQGFLKKKRLKICT